MGCRRGAHRPLRVTGFAHRHAAAYSPPPALRCAIARAAASAFSLLLAVLRGAQALEDLLAGGTHRELLGVAPRHPHLAAERHHRITRHGAVHDLVLADVVRETLVVARLADLFFDPFALDHGGVRRGPSRLPLGREGVVRVVEAILVKAIDGNPRVVHAIKSNQRRYAGCFSSSWGLPAGSRQVR